MFSASKVIAIAAILALTSAQTQGTLPACAQTCVNQYTTGSSIGGCSSIDIKCICSNSAFISGIACCLTAFCDAADQVAATNYALSFCKAAGVTNLPTAVSCTSTASSTATSIPSSSSSSSATGAATTTSSTSSAASSVSSVSSSVSSSAASVSSSVSSSAAKVSSQASASTSSASSAAASATKNAGLHNVAGMGAGVLGGLAAAVAIL